MHVRNVLVIYLFLTHKSHTLERSLQKSFPQGSSKQYKRVDFLVQFQNHDPYENQGCHRARRARACFILLGSVQSKYEQS
jgi:hypothetical protein